MKRKAKKEPLQVTSFRLPLDVKAFLKKKSTEADRTMSYVLVDYLRKWQNYESEEAKQPKIRNDMLLKKGASRYDLPELIEPKSARLYIFPHGDPKTNPGSHSYVVLMVNPYELVRDSNDSEVGMPTMFAVMQNFGNSLLKFFPSPTKIISLHFSTARKKKNCEDRAHYDYD